MSSIIRLLIFSMLVLMVSSCSSSRKTISHRKSERQSTRIKPRPQNPEYTQVRDEVVLEAIRHIGRNYKYGGKKPSSGFDCSGFVSYVFNKAGMNVRGASHQQAKMGEWKSREKLQPGDLIFFGKGEKVSHVAIVVKNKSRKLEVIHSTSSSGVRIDDIHNSKYWNKRYLFSRDIIAEEKSFAGGK